MRVIFLGGFFPEQFSDQILKKSKRQVQNAANKFQWSFIKGLEQNLDEPIQLITAPFIGWYPKYYSDLILKTSTFSNKGSDSLKTMVGFLNLPIIKNVFKFWNLRAHLKAAVSLEEKTVIIIYSLDVAYLRAAVHVKKYNKNVKICVIVPDLHEFPADSSALYGWYIKYYEKPAFYKLLAAIDSFVVLSDQIVKFLNIQDKPWVRVEGLYQSNGKYRAPAIWSKEIKVVLYTGSLDYRYGIRELLDAFNLIKSDHYRLWICGGGNGIDLVKERQLMDSRIQYLGILPTEKVEQLQAEAKILINPRNASGEYNRYSFPSKTIEYFASGTPTLMYKLEGIPEEYFDHCYIVKENTVQSLSDAIYMTCQIDADLLTRKGKEARNFILKNKSAKIQCKKVVSMISELN